MIYEVRTYGLRPGSIPEVEKRFAEALPHREKYSKLGALWHTELGPLNQIVHVWPYESLDQRAELRGHVRVQEFVIWMVQRVHVVCDERCERFALHGAQSE